MTGFQIAFLCWLAFMAGVFLTAALAVNGKDDDE